LWIGAKSEHMKRFKPSVVNYYYLPCQGCTLIFTFFMYVLRVSLTRWCMISGMCVSICVWVCFAWEVGVCFLLRFLHERFLLPIQYLNIGTVPSNRKRRPVLHISVPEIWCPKVSLKGERWLQLTVVFSNNLIFGLTCLVCLTCHCIC